MTRVTYQVYLEFSDSEIERNFIDEFIRLTVNSVKLDIILPCIPEKIWFRDFSVIIHGTIVMINMFSPFRSEFAQAAIRQYLNNTYSDFLKDVPIVFTKIIDVCQ